MQLKSPTFCHQLYKFNALLIIALRCSRCIEFIYTAVRRCLFFFSFPFPFVIPSCFIYIKLLNKFFEKPFCCYTDGKDGNGLKLKKLKLKLYLEKILPNIYHKLHGTLCQKSI